MRRSRTTRARVSWRCSPRRTRRCPISSAVISRPGTLPRARKRVDEPLPVTGIVDAAPSAGRAAPSGEPPRALRLLVYEENAEAIGGNQRYICLLLQYGPQAGMEVVLATPGEGALADMARRYGAVVTLDGPTARHAYPVRCARLRSRIRAVKPDAVLCNNTRSLGTGIVAARLAGTPVLWYVKTETRIRLRNVAF